MFVSFSIVNHSKKCRSKEIKIPGGRFMSATMRINTKSVGVPTKEPITPATIPRLIIVT